MIALLAQQQLGGRLQIVAIVVTIGLFVLVFELVRQRRLMERYALLWLFAATVLFALAVWQDALVKLAHGVGVFYPPSALFAVALGFILVLLLHFSLVISRLADQNKILAQQIGQLNERIDLLEGGQAADGGGAGDFETTGDQAPLRS